MRRPKKRLAKLKKIFSNPLNFREPKHRSYLIKIDRKSIMANPKAGNTSEYEYISTEGTITIKVKHESLEIQYPQVRMVGRSASISKESVLETTQYVFGGNFKDAEAMIEDLKKRFGAMVSFTMQNNYQTINFMRPAPAFLYEYKPTKVKCKYCDAKFPHTELQSDGDEDGDGNYYSSSAICPKCGEWECCSVEYEDIGGIILTRKGLPSLVVG